MTTPDNVPPRSYASAHLRVDGLGDDLAAASLRGTAEGLLSCGVVELTVDLSALDDAYPSFVNTLAKLTAASRAQGCELFLVGLHRPAVVAALDEAPLDELFVVYQAACHHNTAATTTAPIRSQSPVRVGARASANDDIGVGSGSGCVRPASGGRGGLNRRSPTRSRRPRFERSVHE
ncbi:STAS domain-containing protein [Actinomycetospora straminea]|uniref:STAS domain-containing protein n=1 Tax=Actinomycetospora straminea TaxID=663607 RepID=A0ABP9EQW8_9PSEU|nr:hypothetical protein [Actinomycetospora straminea]MDD7935476.1 hypothetical protein [Actinomycetospora straminea]